MGHNDHIDFELTEQIEEAIAAGYLEKGTAAYGVAQQVIHGSYDELSEKQRIVYDKYVVAALKAVKDDMEYEQRERELERLIEKDPH